MLCTAPGGGGNCSCSLLVHSLVLFNTSSLIHNPPWPLTQPLRQCWPTRTQENTYPCPSRSWCYSSLTACSSWHCSRPDSLLDSLGRHVVESQIFLQCLHRTNNTSCQRVKPRKELASNITTVNTNPHTSRTFHLCHKHNQREHLGYQLSVAATLRY